MSLLLSGIVGGMLITWFAPRMANRETEKYYGDESMCDAYRQAFTKANVDIKY